MQQTNSSQQSWSKGVRHSHAPSLDTNASGIAESTISLGLSRFPEPPASIPSTPTRYNFGKSNQSPSSPIASVPRAPLPQPPPQSQPASSTISPSQPRAHHGTSRLAHSQLNYHGTAAPVSSHTKSGYDWQDGASTIDVDAVEDRLLPTSLITSLLQENRELRKANRNSFASDAMSGISEMTYPPILSRSEPYDPLQPSSSRYAPRGTTPNKTQPPSAFPHGTKLTNRMSGDSETLHSLQGHSATRSAGTSRGGHSQGPSIVGFATATLQNISSASQISSTQDSDTIRSYEKGYQTRLATTYEYGDDDISEIKAHNTATYNQSNLVQRRPQTNGPIGDVQGRNSIHSTKSVATSFMSKISGISLRRVFNWRRVKPLPPVPIIPHIPIIDQQARQQEDDSTPLPDLVDRAGTLHNLLEKGHHPHDSLHSYRRFPGSSTQDTYESEARNMYGYPESRHTKLSFGSPAPPPTTPQAPVSTAPLIVPQRNRRLCFIFIVIIVVVAVGVGVGVGISTSRKKSSSLPLCSGNLTGSSCQIDATCVCTSANPCNSLAQSVYDLVPTVNQFFMANKTVAMAFTDLWVMQGTSVATCTSQALLVDTGKELNQDKFPNRSKWAQAALLWNALQTQDNEQASTLQQFVQTLPWSKLASSDSPTEANSEFTKTVAGYTFDFASQTVTQPPATFVHVGQPLSAQIQRVGSARQGTLDRMYTFAQASSIQRQTALKKYWTSVLLQQPNTLSTFKSIISGSPILLPFNASSAAIRGLYPAPASSGLFPPPLACFPGLNSTIRSNLNTFESNVFGLEQTSTPSRFDPSCYPDRPIYGVLDILRLRLPFLDTRIGLPRHAVTVLRDASPRAVVYIGELFSPSSASAPSVTSALRDPRQFGTLNLFDHVILQYLTSISDVATATAFVEFVLGLNTPGAGPPSQSSLLYQALPSLPTLEVALFGETGLPELTNVVSPMTNPSGSLFFGSDNGAALRNMTIGAGREVVWTLNATSPLVVRDSSLAPSTLNEIWNAAAQAIARNDPTVGIGNVTLSMQQTNSFSP